MRAREHDDASYIPRELKEEYEKKDPVAVAERQLLAAGWLTPEETAALKKQYADEVQLAVATAQREPEPDPLPGRLERHGMETLLSQQTEYSHERNIH